ncbi:uncharacterized protein LOC123313955 [Coccinella septempunctata]|uniref:uncharacterized protein LOC123313955 n=1 Tax=Coccinella septempunctata TaxID=41139 RepID=UPI001D0892B8|nr:uncharacterized protein LOC123313955 [Coccinella septempunctata]
MPSIDKLKASIAESMVKRENAFAAASTLLNLVKGLTTEVQVANMCLTELTWLEKSFREADDLIVRLNTQLEESERDESPSTFAAFFETCLHIRAAHSGITIPSSVAAPSSSSVELPIPRVELPCFSGKIEVWPGFIALFDALVHQSTSMAPVQKFHLLSSALSGEAASVISGFERNSANYLLAYQALHSRYQNPRRLADLYVNQILESRPASLSSLPQLKRFITTHQNAINAIKALPISDLADYLLLSDKNYYLTIIRQELLLTIIQQETILRVLESSTLTSARSSALRRSSRPQSPAASASVPISSAQPSPGPSSRPHAYAGVRPSASSSSSSACVYCSANHSIRQCREFKAMNIHQRRAFVAESCVSFGSVLSHMRVTTPHDPPLGTYHLALFSFPRVRDPPLTDQCSSLPPTGSRSPIRAVISRGTSVRGRYRETSRPTGSASSRASLAPPSRHSCSTSGSGTD